MNKLNSSHLLKLKNIYSCEMLIKIENNQNKIDFFYENILPSISINFGSSRFDFRGYKEKQWICSIKECQNISFKSKNFYVRHVIDLHGDNLPGNGEFLESKLYDHLELEMNNNNDNNLSNITKHLSLSEKNHNTNVKQYSDSNLQIYDRDCASMNSIFSINEPENIMDYDCDQDLIDIDLQKAEEEYWLDYFAKKLNEKKNKQ
jgi:hypothetical protein